MEISVLLAEQITVLFLMGTGGFSGSKGREI